MYKLIEHPITNQISSVEKIEGQRLCIPFDSANTDYQEYLKWVAEGGVVIDNPPSE
jgi:hypothetical protein